MFFFGLNEFAGCFVPMWDRMNTNKVVAEMYPNDPDGGAFRQLPRPHRQVRLQVARRRRLRRRHHRLHRHDLEVQEGRRAALLERPASARLQHLLEAGRQQGFKPKLATVAKVLLFPADVAALDTLVNNIATDCWWSPYHPYKSSLTGETAKQLADGFEKASGQQWLQSLGSVHSLFEIAQKALTAVADPHNHTAVAAQLKTLKYTGISGPLDWTKGPVPGVAIQQPVGVQWKKGTKYPYSMVVVDNSLNKDVPLNGTLEPTNG